MACGKNRKNKKHNSEKLKEGKFSPKLTVRTWNKNHKGWIKGKWKKKIGSY